MRRLSGMRSFTVVWVGQIVSLLGTAMTHVALTLWAYEITGRATPLALVGFFFAAVRNVEDVLPDHDAVAPHAATVPK